MSDRKQFHHLADPEEAAAVIADLPLNPTVESVPTEEACDRILAERIDAPIDVPGFDRATLDGYAVRAEDTFSANETNPVSLTPIGAVHAGEQPTDQLQQGDAIEISTGAVLPPGADAMVPIEQIDERDDHILVHTAVAPGENVMFAGADIAAGQRALGAGTRLNPREIGLLSALGRSEVPVYERPVVGVISTGDELVAPGEPIDHQRGEVYDVNTQTLAAAVKEVGATPQLYPRIGDDIASLRNVLTQAAAECDLILTSGSTSASAVDVIYSVLEEHGEPLVHGVAMKPGKPLLVGKIDGTGYIGLPGYPVSAMMNFRTFVAPALRAAVDNDQPLPTTTGRMALEARFEEGRQRLLPVGLIEDGDGATLVYPVDRGSGATTTLAVADGFVTVPATTAYLAVDEMVTVELFSSQLEPPSVLAVGEDDPLFANLIDEVSDARYLAVGSQQAYRRMRADVPDIGIYAQPVDTVLGTPIADWEREWGLIVPAGNPDDVEGIETLIDDSLRFVNRTADSGLRRVLEQELETLAADRDMTPQACQQQINGWSSSVRGHESPVRRVAAGSADVGLGLTTSVTDYDVEIVPIGTQRIQVTVAPERGSKPGVASLRGLFDNLDRWCTASTGYRC